VPDTNENQELFITFKEDRQGALSAARYLDGTTFPLEVL
jgi:hypothetical protein